MRSEYIDYCVIGAIALDNLTFLQNESEEDDIHKYLFDSSRSASFFPTDDGEATSILCYLFDIPNNDDKYDEIDYIARHAIKLNDAGLVSQAWTFLKTSLSEYEYLGTPEKIHPITKVERDFESR